MGLLQAQTIQKRAIQTHQIVGRKRKAVLRKQKKIRKVMMKQKTIRRKY